MEPIKRIATAIWHSRRIIKFGRSPSWDSDIFLKKWVDKNFPSYWGNKPGWYWIECETSIDDLLQLSPTGQFPRKGIQFQEVCTFNVDRFDRSILTPSIDSNVIYSGQEKRVLSRLRAHYALDSNNNSTAALGIMHYPLSNMKWQAGVFHEGMIGTMKTLDAQDIALLRRLVRCDQSRELIEQCWRLEHGWPVLCTK